jgi:hypothetical protein
MCLEANVCRVDSGLFFISRLLLHSVHSVEGTWKVAGAHHATSRNESRVSNTWLRGEQRVKQASAQGLAPILSGPSASEPNRSIRNRYFEALATKLDCCSGWYPLRERAMANDMPQDVHTLWFRGKPYPVSAYPHSPDDGGTIWYVLAGDDWHPVRERRGTEPQEAGWADVDADVVAWLTRNLAQGAEGAPG